MNKEISQETLQKNLEILRDIIKKSDLNPPKVVFLNLKSFYSYLKNKYKIDIQKLMEEIETCIPLTLCVNVNKDLFYMLNIALNEDLTAIKLNKLKKKFYEESQLCFLNIIKTSNEEKWEEILKECENLRKTLKY